MKEALKAERTLVWPSVQGASIRFPRHPHENELNPCPHTFS